MSQRAAASSAASAPRGRGRGRYYYYPPKPAKKYEPIPYVAEMSPLSKSRVLCSTLQLSSLSSSLSIIDLHHLRSSIVSFLIGFPNTSTSIIYYPIAVYESFDQVLGLIQSKKTYPFERLLPIIMVYVQDPNDIMGFKIYVSSQSSSSSNNNDANIGPTIPFSSITQIIERIQLLLPRAKPFDIKSDTVSIYTSNQEKSVASLSRFRDAIRDLPFVLDRTTLGVANLSQLVLRNKLENHQIYMHVEMHSTWTRTRQPDVFQYRLEKTSAVNSRHDKVPYDESERNNLSCFIIEACSIHSTGWFYVLTWDTLQQHGYFSRNFHGGRNVISLQLPAGANVASFPYTVSSFASDVIQIESEFQPNQFRFLVPKTPIMTEALLVNVQTVFPNFLLADDNEVDAGAAATTIVDALIAPLNRQQLKDKLNSVDVEYGNNDRLSVLQELLRNYIFRN